MPTNTFGRELIKLVQIDQDFCNNTFGVAPCTAVLGGAGTECFNTYKSCQDQPNYDRGTKTITLRNMQVGNVGVYAVPSLLDFSVTLPELNIFSRDTKNYELGKFGRCSVTLQDLPFSDNHLDPYVSTRTYNPLENGTFWTKWLARNPYYTGWKIRLYDGFVGQDLDDMNVREYELEKITNPDSSGRVTIKANDLMRKLDATKAIFPPPSSAKLYSDISGVTTSIRTVGRLSYYTSDTERIRYLQIGSDINAFTNAEILTETDNLDGTWTYGLYGLVNTTASAGDYVENGTLFSDTHVVSVVLYLFSLVYEPDEYDAFAIALELAGTNYYSLSSYIATPTPINEILSQLCTECGFYIWYDDIDKQVKVKRVRDETSPVITLDQNKNLIQNSTSSSIMTEDRVSEVYLKYGQLIDFTVEIDNYRKSILNIDSTASSSNEYGSTVVYEKNARWLQLDAAAIDTADNLLQMYRDQTRTISFELDIKDDLRIAQVFKLAWRGFTDVYGNDEVINWICTGRTRSADRLKITAQEFKFNVPEV